MMENTKKALVEWDAKKDIINQMWEEADTNETIYSTIEFENKEADKVREAFYQDTKEINSRSHASLIHPNDPWLRNLIAKNTGV